MPTGPTSLHEKWGDAGPGQDGDENAMHYLRERGYKLLVPRYEWQLPRPDHRPTEEELSAVDYLILEWDFGGFSKS